MTYFVCAVLRVCLGVAQCGCVLQIVQNKMDVLLPQSPASCQDQETMLDIVL